jgi:hypothetical protein
MRWLLASSGPGHVVSQALPHQSAPTNSAAACRGPSQLRSLGQFLPLMEVVAEGEVVVVVEAAMAAAAAEAPVTELRPGRAI